MAVLNKIRQRSLILILVIALALFSFVIGDLFKNSDALTGGDQTVVASINGEDIDRVAFQQKVKNYQDRNQGRVTSTQAMNAIYNQELRSIIFKTEFEKLGLTVEQEEMRDLLKTSFSNYAEFQDENGIFDVNRMNAFIADLKEISPDTGVLTANGQSIRVNYESWITNEQNIAVNAANQSYYNMIKAGVGATLTEAKEDYLGDAKTVDVQYVQIPYTSIADSLVEISKSDIKNYVKFNSEKFKVEASRALEFVEYKEEASKADEDAIKAKLLALKSDRIEFNTNSNNTDTIPGFNSTTDYKAFIDSNSDIKYNDTFFIKSQLPQEAADSLIKLNKGEYSSLYKAFGYYNLSKVVDVMQVADSVKSSHIIIPYAGSDRAVGVTTTRDEAFKIADSLFPLVASNKAKFNAVASEINTDGSKATNGEVGWTRLATFNPNSFDIDYANYIFYTPVGSVEIVETKYGVHIIRIDEAKNYEKAVKFATLSRKIEPSDETLQDVFNKVSKFEIAAQDGDFDALAKERELTLKPVTVKELDENLPGLGSQRDIVRWAFNEDTEVGDFKRFAVSNFGFVVVKLKEKTAKGLMSVENASATALPQVRKEKKAELIRSKISETTLDAIAKNQGVSVKTAAAVNMKNTTLSGAGAEPKVIGAAFGLKEGETSKLIDGDRGVYLIKVTKVNEATELENYNAIMNRLSGTLKNGVQTKVYSALEKAADIEDNRAKTVF